MPNWGGSEWSVTRGINDGWGSRRTMERGTGEMWDAGVFSGGQFVSRLCK